jgi:acetylornithine deacetylase
MRVIELTSELIRRPSVSHLPTGELADFVSNCLGSAGFKVEQQVYMNRSVRKVNIVARKGGDEPKLALSGHLDTVPYKENEWLSDPLALTERNGRFYGMGVCDMKGFIAVAMIAAMRIRSGDLRHPFALVFTSDEEVGCVGARRLTEANGKIADMFVIGEPTELCPVNLHKGYIFMRAILQGVRGHSSEPAKGKNVIERALPVVIQRLMEFKQVLESIRDVRLKPPYPTMNIGKVDTGSGSAKNVIADYCAVDFDIRPVPGQDAAEVIRALQNHVAPDGEVNGIAVKLSPVRPPSLPFFTEPTSTVVRETSVVMGSQPCSTSFNTEGGIFNRSGSQSVICGIGSIQQAHQPNEFVDCRYLQDSVVERYTELILRICGKGVLL